MKQDFVGFSFDGIHSSDLNLLRIASGDRYDEDLHPEVEDKTVKIPGNDGEYYYGSTYGTKSHVIDVAFDSVTETQFRRIRKLFSTKRICPLIYDERPYKVYYAKIDKPVELNYICFDEPIKHPAKDPSDGIRIINREYEDSQLVNFEREQIYPYIYEYDENGNKKTQRIYKGEGKIELTSYFPFAKQQFKILELYSETSTLVGNTFTTYDNVDEWAESSGILTRELFEQYGIDQAAASNVANYNIQIPVYNPGDINVGFCLYIPFTEGKISPQNSDYIEINGDTGTLFLNEIETRDSKGKETGIIINTINHLIEGVIYDITTENSTGLSYNWRTTGNLYNDAIYKGTFPKIHHNDWFYDDEDFKQSISIDCAVDPEDVKIHYDYLYY